jgi:tetratricopeptide (TPR) repeat protein
MKAFALILTFFLSLSSTCQTSDSTKKKALDFENKAWSAYQSHEFEKCISLLDSSISLDSTRPFAFIIKSESLWFLKRYAEAAETYKKWMTLEKNVLLVGAYVFLGMLYDKADIHDQAKEQYIKAIKTYEKGYKPIATFENVEEIEYVFAFGLLSDTEKWRQKLAGLIKKYPSSNYERFEKMSRKELLEFHFEPFSGG